jgi:hypothetical protein
MAIKSYVLQQDFATPYVIATGRPHNPQQIKVKKFRKGDIVKGELKHANNKPAFILAENNAIVGLDTVKEIFTKQVGAETRANEMSSFNGSTTGSETKKVAVPTNPKVRYIDAMLLGALVGVIGVVIAEKQGWIPEPDKKYKMYGALGGAVAAAYIVYRTSNGKPKVQIVNKQEFILN